ncbi:MAG: DUF6790 family protein [Candidatus Baltobacteraceae bacterium]
MKHQRPGNRASLAQILWKETVFYAVGIGFFYTGIFHAFFPAMAAPAIGWAPSPFEWELACAEFGVGTMGIWSLWRSNEFRLPVTLIFAIFSLGAAVQHIHQILCCANYAPGNAGAILWVLDIALPLFLLVVASLSVRTREVV